MDASNMLKPALARGELHCVGATTLDEYRKHIEKDAALARRFQPVFVSEPTVEDTISILRGIKEKYEVHHGVRITDSALVAAATLSHRYISDRFLPDKAIDLMDEAASRLRMQVEFEARGARRARPRDPAEADRGGGPEEGDRPREPGPAGEAGAGAFRARGAVGGDDRALEGGARQAEGRGRHQGEARPGAGRAGQRQAAGQPRAGGRARLRHHPGARARPGGGRGQGRPGDGRGGGDAGADRPGGRALDRHPGRPDARGRAREAPPHGGGDRPARHRPARGGRGGVERGQAGAGGAERPEPAAGVVPLPRADGRRQDRADQGAGGVPLRRRPGDGPDRHVASSWRSTRSRG